MTRRGMFGRWELRRLALLVDVLLALALTAAVQLHVWTAEAQDEVFPDRPLSSAVLLFATLPLAARRRLPLLAAAAYAAAGGVQALATQTFTSSPGLFFAGMVALYSVGAHADRRDALAGLGLVAMGVGIREYFSFPRSELDNWNAVFFYVLLVLAFVAGMYMRSRRRTADLERQADRLRREGEEQARAVSDERARIARELHDVVAHSVSAAVVQAEAADEVLDREPEKARQSLARIQRSGREALGEMRRLLGIMRNGEGLAPQPRIADLGRLIDEAQMDDLAVTLTVEGRRRDLPPGIDLSAYRVVQEAVTNVRKHAGRPAQASVLLRYRDATLELEIVDDGQGPAAGDRRGHGLIGMHERVAFFGGEFSAGPTDAGGFSVKARFPLPGIER